MIARLLRPGIAWLLAATLGAEPAALALPAPRAHWLRLDTPSFTVLGDVSPGRLREVAVELERFRAALARLRPETKRPAPLPTLVLACDGERSLAPYRALGRSDTKNIRGVFHHHSAWGSSLALDAGQAIEASLSTALHEYVHYFVATTYPATPLWLNEGLAELYSTFRTTAAGVEVGRPVERHVLRLRDGWQMPLSRLFAVGHESPEYVESERASAFYAQSWALVHYLLVGEPEMAARAPAFLAALDREPGPDAAARQALGVGLVELEERLRRYVAKPSFRYLTYAITDLAVPELPAPVEIGRGELLTLLAEHLAHAGDAAGAAEHLAALSPTEAAAGDPLALAGYLAEERKDLATARGLFRRAAAAHPRRASSWLHIARFAIEDSDDRAARQAAEAALAIAPEYGEAWATLGLAALNLQDSATAIRALTEAERRMPDRGDLVFNRFLAHLAAGDLATAKTLVEGKIAQVGGPKLAAEARRQLDARLATEEVNRAVEAANAAYAAGDPVAAAEAIRRVRARLSDPEAIAFLDARLAEAERNLETHRRIAAYNRAIELANGGRLAEARATLAALLAAGCGDEPVCDAARDLAANLEKQQRRR